MRFLCIALGTFLVLLVPLLGNWPWTFSDFVVMGALLFVVGTLVDLALRKAGRYRVLAALGIVFLFPWLWVELAVGLFTDWGS